MPLPIRRGHPPTLKEEIEKIQRVAMRSQEQCHELGVFIFFSTQDGDAWVLETTERDALQVAASGKPLPLPLQEDHEIIEVDWSHSFDLRERSLLLTDHQKGEKTELTKSLTERISAALRRIVRQYPAALLRQVHVQPQLEP